MATKRVSSDQARTGWRHMLDAVATGDTIIIERYGKPVAVLSAYQDFAEGAHESADIDVVKEETAVYQTKQWESIKAELAAEIKAELLASEQNNTADWLTGWQILHTQVKETGGLLVGLDKEEIVSHLQQIRQEIFEAEYAHLY